MASLKRGNSMHTHLKTIAAALCAATLALPSGIALAIVTPPATASIDWSTFSVQVFDMDPSDSITSALTWNYQSTWVSADAGASVSDSAFGSPPLAWISTLSVADGVASAMANASSLNAEFSASPASLNAWAQSNRDGGFSLTANTLAIFSVDASAYIDMNAPINGSAYAWARLGADGVGPFGTDSQHSYGDKIAWANGVGNPPVTDAGKLYATFTNLTGSGMNGTVFGFATVNRYGFIPVVPEPETWAMLLVGVGLVGWRLQGCAHRDNRNRLA
jgi:hypothetical protein